MPETEDFHIGEIIKRSLQRQQRSAAWLARQLCTDVSNGPKILKQQHLHAYCFTGTENGFFVSNRL